MQQERFKEYRVSKLVIGTAQFGLPYGAANRTGQPEYNTVCEILETAFARGVNVLDTAALYGESEKILGRALQDLRLQEKAFVITKVPWIHGCVDPEPGKVARFVADEVARSLRSLRLEYLPLCLLHRAVDLPYLEHLIAMKDKGLVRYVGVSVASPQHAMKALNSEIDAIQHPTSVLDQRFLRSGLFEKSKKNDVSLFLRSVYLQGLLVLPEEEITEELKPVKPVWRKLARLAERSGMGLPELALRFVVSIAGSCGIVVGMENREQLESNLEVFEKGKLPATLLNEIQSAVPELSDRILDPAKWPAKQKISWTRT